MDLAEYLGCNQVPNSLVPFYEAALIKSFKSNNQSKVEILHKEGRRIVFKAGNLLSTEQCKEILRSPSLEIFEKKFIFWNEVPLYKIQVGDKEFASGLWDAVHPLLKSLVDDAKLNCQPLGFDVGRGDWVLHDLNSTLKLQNTTVCTKVEHLLPRKDAQLCASPDQRSVLTLLIFLNEDYEGGETNFYLPKDKVQYQANLRKGVTVKEEIEAVGGLENGYTCLSIKPKAGDALFFSHDILHASSEVTSKAKLVLKTEVIVKRINKIPGIAIAEHEKEDYLKCLNFLRSGVSHAVNDFFMLSEREFYERALAVRYSYPDVDLSSNSNLKSQTALRSGEDINHILPDLIWNMIFDYISGVDIENCVKAFPGLESVRKDWESRRFLKDEQISPGSLLFIPEIDSKEGVSTCFKFKDGFYFYDNSEACVRVATMYALALMGWLGPCYPVRFDSDTQDVHPLSLNSLLIDTFLDRPFHGAVYTVQKRSPEKKAYDDFHNSVDRCYMSLRHNSQFIGLPLCKQMSVKVEWPDVTEKNIADFVRWESDFRGGRSEWLHNCPFDLKYRSASPDRDYEVTDYSYLEDDDWRTDLLHSRFRGKPDGEILEKFCFDYGWDIANFIYVGGYAAVIKDILKYYALKEYCDEYPGCNVDWPNSMLTYSNAVVWIGHEHSSDFDSRWKLGADLTASQIYLKKILEIAEKKRGSSAALISKIHSPVIIEGEEICLCEPPFGESFGGYGFGSLKEQVVSIPYNRLLFDFSSHKLTVSEDSGSEDDAVIDKREDECFFYNTLKTEFYRETIEELELSNVCMYTVGIDPIGLSKESCSRGESSSRCPRRRGNIPRYDYSGRHCSCRVPGFELTEYHTLYDYPNLDHVHVIAGMEEDTHEVLVWVIYGGL